MTNNYRFADFHCDTLLNVYLREMDFSKLNEMGHLDLPRLKIANHDLQCFAVFSDPKFGQEAMLRQTLKLIDVAHQRIFSHPDMILVKSGFDLDKIIENKKLAGLLAIEGADFLGDDLFLIDLVHHLGVRLITLVWNGRNSIADGVKVRENAGGLTGIGTQAVKRMQELGIIVDVSHLSEKGFWDVSRVTSRAFVASHSNARAVCDHPRNLWDDQIREIAKNKGLIGMNLCRPFVAAQEEDQTLATVIRHISHIADVAGTEVLCLGCDLDGIREMPTGMADVRDVVRIADLLGEAGFLPAEIEAITSKNLLRFVKNNLE